MNSVDNLADDALLEDTMMAARTPLRSMGSGQLKKKSLEISDFSATLFENEQFSSPSIGDVESYQDPD